MAKPTVNTEWAATLSAQSIIDKNGNAAVVLNRVEPSNSYKGSGIPPATPVIRNYFNYWMNAVHQRLNWLYATEVGTVLEFADSAGMTSILLQNDRGGTWVDHGTYTKAGLLTRVFSKTS
jgi:hypothetical protein